MNLDIRFPLGSLFAILGCLLLVYGVCADGSELDVVAGLRVNLTWGVVLLVFGLLMLMLAVRSARKAAI